MRGTKLSVRVRRIAAANPKVMDALGAFDTAIRAATQAKCTLSDALKDTPEWRLLEGAGGEPVVSVDRFGSVHITTRVREEYVPQPNTLAPQTLNALITGKLLTDDEKRALLTNQGIRVTVPAAPTGSDADASLIVSDFDDEIPF